MDWPAAAALIARWLTYTITCKANDSHGSPVACAGSPVDGAFVTTIIAVWLTYILIYKGGLVLSYRSTCGPRRSPVDGATAATIIAMMADVNTYL
jgi:hypothetical protein